MTLSAPRYITDSEGTITSVIISIQDYEKILEMIEDLEDVELYDEVKSRNEEYISFNGYILRTSEKFFLSANYCFSTQPPESLRTFGRFVSPKARNYCIKLSESSKTFAKLVLKNVILDFSEVSRIFRKGKNYHQFDPTKTFPNRPLYPLQNALVHSF